MRRYNYSYLTHALANSLDRRPRETTVWATNKICVAPGTYLAHFEGRANNNCLWEGGQLLRPIYIYIYIYIFIPSKILIVIAYVTMHIVK